MEKALIIRGPLKDLSDVLRIARTEGRKALHMKKVKVKPLVYPYLNNNYLVIVEPDGYSGSEAFDVEGGTENEW